MHMDRTQKLYTLQKDENILWFINRPQDISIVLTSGVGNSCSFILPHFKASMSTKQRIWSDLGKAWLRIKGKAKWVFSNFMRKAPEKNGFLFTIFFLFIFSTMVK